MTSKTIPRPDLAPKKSSGFIVAGIIASIAGLIAQAVARTSIESQVAALEVQRIEAILSGTAALAPSLNTTGLLVAGFIQILGLVLLAVGLVRMADAIDLLVLFKHIEIHTELEEDDEEDGRESRP